MNYFSGKDLELIEALDYQPELEPSYEVIKDALIWEDERPSGLSTDGYEKLCDLWIARSFIHREIPFSNWSLDPKYFENVWSEAIKQGFKWSGFNRLILSKNDKDYYMKKRSEVST
jgi:hypothetical protein